MGYGHLKLRLNMYGMASSPWLVFFIKAKHKMCTYHCINKVLYIVFPQTKKHGIFIKHLNDILVVFSVSFLGCLLISPGSYFSTMYITLAIKDEALQIKSDHSYLYPICQEGWCSPGKFLFTLEYSTTWQYDHVWLQCRLGKRVASFPRFLVKCRQEESG